MPRSRPSSSGPVARWPLNDGDPLPATLPDGVPGGTGRLGARLAQGHRQRRRLRGQLVHDAATRRTTACGQPWPAPVHARPPGVAGGAPRHRGRPWTRRHRRPSPSGQRRRSSSRSASRPTSATAASSRGDGTGRGGGRCGDPCASARAPTTVVDVRASTVGSSGTRTGLSANTHDRSRRRPHGIERVDVGAPLGRATGS